MANPTGRGGFKKGKSANPGGRPRAAAPKLRRPSTTAKERGVRAKKPAQTPPTYQTSPTNDATQSSSIKEVLVGDALAPIAIDIRTNEQGTK
jgi:hypothetical protein